MKYEAPPLTRKVALCLGWSTQTLSCLAGFRTESEKMSKASIQKSEDKPVNLAGAVVTPITRKPVAEQVAQQLLGLIKSGNLKPGQQLPPERELATILDVSRPSLREALRALSLLGVINIRQGGGVYVSSLDPESLLGPLHFFITLNDHNLDSLFDARILIESAITGLAASRITPDQLSDLKAIVKEAAASLDDPGKFIETDVAFHRAIFDAADNSFLVRVATSLHVLGRASREITGYLPGVLETSLADHRRILKAIATLDSQKAEAAMKKHLKNVKAAYEKNKT